MRYGGLHLPVAQKLTTAWECQVRPDPGRSLGLQKGICYA
jgi:hypothetical protein